MNLIFGFAVFVVYILFLIVSMYCVIFITDMIEKKEVEKARIKEENHKDINNIKNN